jgi:hypothetical protein
MGELESSGPCSRFNERPLSGFDLVGHGRERFSLTGQRLPVREFGSETNANEFVTHLAGNQSSNGAGIQTVAEGDNSVHFSMKSEQALLRLVHGLATAIEFDVPAIACQEVEHIVQRFRNRPVIPSIRIVDGNAQMDLSFPNIGGTPLGPVAKFDSGCNQQRIVSNSFPSGEEIGFEAGGRELNVFANLTTQ